MSAAISYSIRGRLLVWLLCALVVAGLLIGYSAYHRSQEDLNELLDYQLKQLAFSLSRQSIGRAPMPRGLLPEPDFITQVWDKDGVLMFYSRPNLDIPMRPQPGFSNVDWNGQSWRVFTQLDGLRIIQVAHPLSLRQEMAADLTRRAVLPSVARRRGTTPPSTASWPFLHPAARGRTRWRRRASPGG